MAVYQIQLRRGTSTNWQMADPVLAAGEPGYETDTGFIKFGDGSTSWNDLDYFIPIDSTYIENWNTAYSRSESIENVETQDVEKWNEVYQIIETLKSSSSIQSDGTLHVTSSDFGTEIVQVRHAEAPSDSYAFLGAPDGNGEPTFRTIQASDIPVLNQNTTGTAANVTGVVSIANGGTGATNASQAKINLGLVGATTEDDGLVTTEDQTWSGIKTSTNFSATSDKKLKKKIKDLSSEDCLNKVLELSPKSFVWKDSEAEDTGLIAQEVQKVLPERVHDDGHTLSISYANIVTQLIGAIQNQQDQIKKLEARLADLENKES